MNSKLFREKSLERVSSPEQLNDYIRVANPSVWIALIAVVILLVGICVWSVFGRLDTLLTVGAITHDNQTVCFVKESDVEPVSVGMTVRLEDQEFKIARIALRPIQIDGRFPIYLNHVGGIHEGEWVYTVVLDGVIGEEGGIYKAQIVLESIAPMTFVIN